jgi:hypothetical protein
MAPDNRIHLTLSGNLCKISTKCLECGCFDVLALFVAGATGERRLKLVSGGKVRIEFGKNFGTTALDVYFQRFEDTGSNPFAFTKKAKQNVLGANVTVVKRLRFLARERQNFFDSRGVGNVSGGFGLGPGSHLLFNGSSNSIEIKSHFLQNVNRYTLTEIDQPKQQMLRPHVVMVKAISLFAG